MDFEPWKSLSRAFAEANLRKIFRESFANVVLPFAEPSYFNSPINLHMEVLAAAQIKIGKQHGKLTDQPKPDVANQTIERLNLEGFMKMRWDITTSHGFIVSRPSQQEEKPAWFF